MSSSGASAQAVRMAMDDTEDNQLASMYTVTIWASCLLNNVKRPQELESFKEKIKENQGAIKLNKQLSYLVDNIVELSKIPKSTINFEDFLKIVLEGGMVMVICLRSSVADANKAYRLEVHEFIKRNFKFLNMDTVEHRW